MKGRKRTKGARRTGRRRKVVRRPRPKARPRAVRRPTVRRARSRPVARGPGAMKGKRTPVRRSEQVRGFTLWFTGLSGSGKTTVADRVAKILDERGYMVQRLDGDIVRKSLTRDLGFSKEDRDKNIERVTFVAELLTKHGVAALVSFISPYREVRARSRAQIGEFIEVFVKCSLDECMRRDVKGMYKKAIAGEIKEFTGISDPYEEPLEPEITIETDKETVDESVANIIKYLEKNCYI
jgi:adenylyl-sulfate kinase